MGPSLIPRRLFLIPRLSLYRITINIFLEPIFTYYRSCIHRCVDGRAKFKTYNSKVQNYEK